MREATVRFAGLNCKSFQRLFEVALPNRGHSLAKEKGAFFLLASFVVSSREILTASFEGLRAIAAAAASNGDGDGDGEAGGDILCNDSQKSLKGTIYFDGCWQSKIL